MSILAVDAYGYGSRIHIDRVKARKVHAQIITAMPSFSAGSLGIPGGLAVCHCPSGPTSTTALAYSSPYDPGATGNVCQGKHWKSLGHPAHTDLLMPYEEQALGPLTVEATVYEAFDNTGSYCGLVEVEGTVTPTNHNNISLNANTATIYVLTNPQPSQGPSDEQQKDVTSILGKGISIYVGGPNDHTNPLISNGIELPSTQCLTYNAYITYNTGSIFAINGSTALICP